MIDLGLTKIAVIGVVALVVIGPEKLPKVARMAGTLYGRAQRYLHDVKSEVSREMELEELKNLRKQAEEAASTFKDEMDNSIGKDIAEVEAAFRNDDPSAAPALDLYTPSTDDMARKAKDFRRKRVVRSSAVPLWYKQQAGVRSHVISGAARMKRHRPGSRKTASFF
ncbi:Sec-independent protein translocase subunit TatB [Pseudoduganella sp. DS3]|uniref:Sec-independent protein translocase protein TatB n=1 Tax=Pseudoduganella guangdongensis TaxID=2692179 RepID=A0A6N9HC13_9BURK|nr:Sec-independent protein translocase protein TatB [Pseudoduganella guangdongensis]MYN01000.1 Sec-independent protein translocase subunit TatB [Pseudoduganella guangdongensis]